MAATSVTGTGAGSCEGKDMGSKHDTLSVGRLLGPRVVLAETVTLDGSGDYTFKCGLSGVTADYLVLCTAATVSSPGAMGATLTISSGEATITLKGTAAQAVNFVIVKIGPAL